MSTPRDLFDQHYPDCAEKSDGTRGHFCYPCSDKINDYVNWPCPAVIKGVAEAEERGRRALVDRIEAELASWHDLTEADPLGFGVFYDNAEKTIDEAEKAIRAALKAK